MRCGGGLRPKDYWSQTTATTHKYASNKLREMLTSGDDHQHQRSRERASHSEQRRERACQREDDRAGNDADQSARVVKTAHNGEHAAGVLQILDGIHDDRLGERVEHRQREAAECGEQQQADLRVQRHAADCGEQQA